MKAKINISVIIIAGGKSKRMGNDKRLIQLGSKSLPEYALALANKISDDIIVSSNDPLPVFDNYNVVPDIIQGGGPLIGLISCLPHIRNREALALSADMPFVTIDLIHSLLEKHKPDEVTYFTMNGRIQPFPAVYSAAHIERIEHAYANNITSMKGIISLLPSRTILHSQSSKLNSFLNINRKEDLKLAIQSIGKFA